MKLIVGLGNPGNEYQQTRHNIGFMVIDDYISNQNIKFQKKFNGLYLKLKVNGESFILLKPLSFMNLSGTVVKRYIDYFKIKPQDILVIQDDIDLPCGRIRIKASGSSGGHNGIKNIIEEIKTENFNRLKIGIGRNKNDDVVNYVLGKLTMEEKERIGKVLEVSNNIINDFIIYDISTLMNKYNGEKNEYN